MHLFYCSESFQEECLNKSFFFENVLYELYFIKIRYIIRK